MMNEHRILCLSLSTLLVLLLLAPVDTHAQDRVVFEGEIEMTCFPFPPFDDEPPIGDDPPCLMPIGVDDKFVSPSPSGTAKVKVMDDGTTKISIKLDGLAPDLVLTATTPYYFPGEAAPDPIFDLEAALSVPLAPTYAGFTQGTGPEPNQFETNDDRARLKVDLDWNILEANAGPLRNDMSTLNQADAPAGSDAEQFPCCSTNPLGIDTQPVGAALLRVYDPATGYQILDGDGRPELLRSPVAPVMIAVLVHIDETTHGRSSGVPIFPVDPTAEATDGDHFALGMFDLRSLSGEQASKADIARNDVSSKPGVYRLSAAYPNPFNPSTQFTLSLAQDQHVQVGVYDLLGRQVKLLHDAPLGANRTYQFNFEASDLASGTYLIRVVGETFQTTKNIALLK